MRLQFGDCSCDLFPWEVPRKPNRPRRRFSAAKLANNLGNCKVGKWLLTKSFGTSSGGVGPTHPQVLKQRWNRRSPQRSQPFQRLLTEFLIYVAESSNQTLDGFLASDSAEAPRSSTPQEVRLAL
jgi:hypothetical protein